LSEHLIVIRKHHIAAKSSISEKTPMHPNNPLYEVWHCNLTIHERFDAFIHLLSIACPLLKVAEGEDATVLVK
ncbi:hypothetical protein KIN20_015810, partial [Parelaphostrongylus tenuis]